jgi:hypothetical protein
MKKLFNNLAGNIAAISISLEAFTNKINSNPTKYIKKIVARTEKNLNKISSSINNSNLNPQQQLKLQQLLDKELEKLKTLQATIEEQQQAAPKIINIPQECEKLRKLLEKLNKNIPEQANSTVTTLTQPQKTELLTQLKSFKAHIKSFSEESAVIGSNPSENLQLSVVAKPSL